MAPSKCFVSFWFPVNNAIKTGVCGFVFIPNDDFLDELLGGGNHKIAQESTIARMGRKSCCVAGVPLVSNWPTKDRVWASGGGRAGHMAVQQTPQWGRIAPEAGDRGCLVVGLVQPGPVDRVPGASAASLSAPASGRPCARLPHGRRSRPGCRPPRRKAGLVKSSRVQRNRRRLGPFPPERLAQAPALPLRPQAHQAFIHEDRDLTEGTSAA